MVSETSIGGGEPIQTEVLVIGAGIGGIYAVHRCLEEGLGVVCLEAASHVGGVWHHNRYPGARVDIESFDYCFHFSPEIYRDWQWSERYAAQPELFRYLEYVADRTGAIDHIRFNARVVAANWKPADAEWHVRTDTGTSYRARFVLMATGNLSAPRPPAFEGMESFRGQIIETSSWPGAGVDWRGKRVGIIGTGSSGVQAIPVIAKDAAKLTVFQRTANYSVPAQNGPMQADRHQAVIDDVLAERARMMDSYAGINALIREVRPSTDYSPEEQQAALERQWQEGGQGMMAVFADQQTNPVAAELVSEFVRSKIRQIVRDPITAETLCPKGFPIGVRRLGVDTDYYDTFNRDNVELVDVKADPIVRITPNGVETASGEHPVDILIFALGFDAFTGAIDRAGIRNEKGEAPTDRWRRGPRTLLGLMIAGFPNLFMVSGPGSPSVLVNLMLMNEYSIDWIVDCIKWLDAKGARTIEATVEAEDAWVEEVAKTASHRLAARIPNWMTHQGEDGSRAFIPYAAGLKAYRVHAEGCVNAGYAGFRTSR
ncbi:flavin-containing monooxygenase [Sphingomonas crocodyli]|uniref:flavin-containing monooxygenase n=1 Tax=Sphingomonas crocodyli TaxID=1979270 RepID=UPI0013E3D954|nr:NAD(P)/FAD-dependent oxidoreductase [Sphingomonas crocodyli]